MSTCICLLEHVYEDEKSSIEIQRYPRGLEIISN
jgi:hypothetical protein